MYSSLTMVVAKKKTFKSQIINLAPCFYCEITLLINNTVSTSDAPGDPASPSLGNLSPPQLILFYMIQI